MTGPQREHSTRDEHCLFPCINKDGKCIAICSKNRMIGELFFDCTGIRSLTVEEHEAQMNNERKIH